MRLSEDGTKRCNQAMVVTESQRDKNRLRLPDIGVHDWYRFVLSFPPHLVQDYLDRFGLGASHTVLDPFCGTGTTLVECKKQGIESIGIESNPMAHFASSVKVKWDVNPISLQKYVDTVIAKTKLKYEQDGIEDCIEQSHDNEYDMSSVALRKLKPDQERLLIKNSISPLPLHKSLLLLDTIDRHGDYQQRQLGRLALAQALVLKIGNLKFGPEVGVGQIKTDSAVVSAWSDTMMKIINDLSDVAPRQNTKSHIFRADAREMGKLLSPRSIDAVITSPPYPNEKDYTRTTRLESVILGLIRDRQELRSMKQSLIRSNTRGVYKIDDDDKEIKTHAEIQNIASSIEKRRIEMGKTSGFERMYPRVVQLYFGGMARHLSTLRDTLKPGANLAYVVGDQASYLRVMIRTGRLLSEIAESLGYKLVSIDLFRNRRSTVTGDHLREEVVVLEWPGS